MDAKRSKSDPKYNPFNLTLDAYDHEEKSDDSTIKGDEEELDDLPPLEGVEEKVKQGKELPILIPNKL